MWLPVTPGEEVFLALYKEAAPIRRLAAIGGLHDSLVNPEAFQQFTQIAAALEVSIRTFEQATQLYRASPSSSPQDFRSRINSSDVALPTSIGTDMRFWESVKQSAVNIASEEQLRESLKSLSSAVYRSNHSDCYLCGNKLDRTKDSRNHRSIDHLWPICLGGSNSLENLVPACSDCNGKRGEAVTWAWGPVASTRQTKAAANPPHNLRLSMGFARMMLYAERHRTRHGLTLKSTLKGLFPACIDLGLNANRHETYFEIFNRMKDNVWQLAH